MLAGKGGRGDRAWDRDLNVFVGPGIGHLTDLVLPGEVIFESFFAVRSGKIWKSWRPTRTSESWVDFTVLSSNFVCFSVFLIN